MTPQERQIWVRRMGARADWWARRQEAVVEPDWEIVDAHCHFWTERSVPDPQDETVLLRTSRYLPEDFRRDAGTGHRITACIYVECGSSYYEGGPDHLRPVGETEYAVDLAAEMASADGATNLAAIVAHADLRHPDLAAVLDAHGRKGGGLVRGIRHSGARLADPSARLLAGAAPPGLYADPDFRRGVALLGERGLVFDAFQFHFQLGDLVDLAHAVPGTTIVVNHLGAPVGFSRPFTSDDAVFAAWTGHVETLARLPNIVMKLGGLASIVTGYDGNRRETPPSSQDFIDDRGAYFHHAIRCFGPARCMFESNFPVDSVSIGYGVLWNAYKRMAMDYDESTRRALLAETARRVYRL
jgi:predicted TIM-barrel fold metal-dependent hydrolase